MNYETPCIKLSQGYANLMLTALILTISSLDKNKNFGRLNKQLSILLFNFLFKRRPVPNELAFYTQLQFLYLELFSRSAETAPVPDRTGDAVPVPVPSGKPIWTSSVVDLSVTVRWFSCDFLCSSTYVCVRSFWFFVVLFLRSACCW